MTVPDLVDVGAGLLPHAMLSGRLTFEVAPEAVWLATVTEVLVSDGRQVDHKTRLHV